MEPHRIVSQDEWLAARRAHLAEEKAFTRARDTLSRKRRELPWVKVETDYVFDRYDGAAVDPTATYVQPKNSPACCE